MGHFRPGPEHVLLLSASLMVPERKIEVAAVRLQTLRMMGCCPQGRVDVSPPTPPFFFKKIRYLM